MPLVQSGEVPEISWTLTTMLGRLTKGNATVPEVKSQGESQGGASQASSPLAGLVHSG